MKRKLSIPSALTLVLMAVLLTFLVTNFAVTEQFNQKMLTLSEDKVEFQKLSTIDEIVREHYALKADEVAQSEMSITGYVEGLGDSYSRYMTSQEYEAYLSEKEVKTVYSLGFSIALNEESGLCRIYRVDPSSEAEKNGMQVGDTLLSIGDVSVKKDGFEAVEKLLTGKKGTSVGVKVSRGKNKKKITYTITYKEIRQESVTATMELDQAGRVVLNSFEDTTKDELRSAINRLLESGAIALIFDVRGVSSVNFESALSCADVIAGMTPLCRVQTKGGAEEVIKGDGASIPFECAVLIDQKTYGAPELFAASLRDSVDAQLVGNKSAGCASQQSEIVLNDGSAILLTTAVYLPPESESFESVGLTPDLKVDARVDHRSVEIEDDKVFTAAYYLLKPDKIPGGDSPIEIPNQGEGTDNPTLLEPNMKPTEDKDKTESSKK